MLRDTNNKKKHFVIVGKGGGGGIEQVQSDWAQTDNTQVDYIKNKPTIKSEWFGTQAEFDLIGPKDANTIYYIEDANGSVVHNNKTYGIKVKIENPELTDVQITSNGTYQHTGYYGYDEVTVNVQPNLYPDYLTVTYVVPEITNNFKILNNTNNIAGYRVKGATTWETPTTTIAVTTIGTLELEFNLTDNTKIAENQFYMVLNVCKVDLPATVTRLEDGCFYNCRCLTEMPNLQNVTYIGGDALSSVNIHLNKYVINDNVVRDYRGLGSTTASGYLYVNGTLYHYLDGSMNNSVSVHSYGVDLSNGIDGLPIYKITFHYRGISIPTVKLPSTLTEIGELAFMEDTITDVYMYATTPPTGGGFYNCNITNFYVPQGSLTAYQTAYPNYASVMQEMS